MKNRWKKRLFILTIASIIVWLQPCSSLGQNDSSTSLLFAQLMEESAYSLGILAYVYGYPVVEMYWGRYRFTSAFGLNRLYHFPRLADHRSMMRGANNDTLYSLAWVDLSREPVLLHVPDTQGRYYVFQLIDFFTNTFDYVGKRVTGTQEGDYAIVGPGWQGSLPMGIKRINAPTNSVLLLGRTLVYGQDDLPNVNALQELYKLTPLSRWGKNGKDPYQLRKPVRPPIDHWGHPLKFFQILNVGLGENPPPAHDAGLMGLFKIIHVGQGKPFDIDAMDPAIVKGLERAIKIGKQISSARPSTTEQARFGLSIGNIGSYEGDYLSRFAYAIAPGGIGALTPDECIYFGVHVDHEGQTLSGKHSYRLRFEKGTLPPVDAFWSVTIYKLPAFQLVENPISRYSIGDRSKGLKYGQDGSLEIIIQQSPPDGTKQANWLPAPGGDFSLLLRAYMPTTEILDGQWTVPPVSRIE